MDFCNLCTRVFDRSDRRTMKFDDFIQCCVMLRSLTEGFKKLDTNRNGIIQINYEQVGGGGQGERGGAEGRKEGGREEEGKEGGRLKEVGRKKGGEEKGRREEGSPLPCCHSC